MGIKRLESFHMYFYSFFVPKLDNHLGSIRYGHFWWTVDADFLNGFSG